MMIRRHKLKKLE